MIISNEELNTNKIKKAEDIISNMQKELASLIEKGFGPFMAAIYDENGNIIVKTVNTVINDKCSNNHAEINAIREAEKHYGTYDLAPYNLSLYITAEPCMMCIGGILWSGIKNVYFGVPSKRVEEITGFDEGFKPNWFEEFKKRGITVYGNFAQTEGENVLEQYIKTENKIYKPSI